MIINCVSTFVNVREFSNNLKRQTTKGTSGTHSLHNQNLKDETFETVAFLCRVSCIFALRGIAKHLVY